MDAYKETIVHQAVSLQQLADRLNQTMQGVETMQKLLAEKDRELDMLRGRVDDLTRALHGKNALIDETPAYQRPGAFGTIDADTEGGAL